MSHPIDVGSVLGGRYKVTATVLTSHDHDLVLDGVDQVLNRPVSILVAGPDNAEQVAQSAREVATGERPGNVQILDLGVSDSTTYLITNHTSAPDLLDLVVASNPPYVEPFFTDTLGSEIFGQARSHEPETYDGLYDEEEVDAGYIKYGNSQPAGQERKQASPPVVPPVVPSRATPVRPASAPSVGSAGAGAAAAGTAGAAGLAGGAAAGKASSGPSTAPQPTTPQATAPQQAVPRPREERPAESLKAAQAPAPEAPKVSLWAEDDYDYRDEEAPSTGPAKTARERMAGSFPAYARNSQDNEPDEYYDDEPVEREPRSMRWLVGGILAAVLVVGLIFAVSNLGSLFKSEPQSNPAPGTSGSASQPQTTGQTTPSPSSAPAAGPPAIESVSRLGDFDFAATYDGDLSKTFDGNGASYWSDMEFATDNWGGLAPDVPLVVKLKSSSKVSSITLSQLGGSGGSISVFTNDRPSMDGAKQVGTNSFTSPDLTMPLPEPVTAQYVIVSIKNLPKLAAPKTRFGYGLRLAEVKVQ